MPIFRYFLPEILNQCNTHPDKTHLSFMRKCIAKGSRGKFYPDQKLLVEGQGFGVTSLTERIFFNVVCILTSGTCPDVRTPKTHARTPDSVALNGDNYQLAVGNFDPRGLDVLMGNSNSVDVGVAPGVPAEVRPSGT